jgi:hypothetical protein
LASEYTSSKFAAIDSIAFAAKTTQLAGLPQPPTNLVVTPTPTGYLIGWAESITTTANRYLLEYQEIDSNTWHLIPMLPGYTDQDFSPPTPGILVFRVAAVDLSGKQSEWLYSEASSQLYGNIQNWSDDGSVTLDKSVVLAAGTTYWLRTLNPLPGGAAYESRQITTVAGTHSTISVSPGFLGQSITLTGPSSALPFSDGSFVIINFTVASSVRLWGNANFSGTMLEIVRPANSQAILRSDSLGALNNNLGSVSIPLINTGATIFIYQFAPGQSPVPGSKWELRTTA